MRTKQLGSLLMEFAGLADVQRSDGLYRLARFFNDSGNVTVQARLKHAMRSTRHPAILKADVDMIRKGLLAAGAKKQASLLGELLELFAGPPGSSAEEFLIEIVRAPHTTPIPSPGLKAEDLVVVERMAGALTNQTLDDDARGATLQELNSPAVVSRPVLALIARRILGEGHVYRDRRTTISAIARRLARDYAGGADAHDPFSRFHERHRIHG